MSECKGLRHRFVTRLVLAAIAAVAVLSPSRADPINARYSWMLPKTLIDVTVTYAFQSCKFTGGQTILTLKVTSTTAPRAAADTYLGLKSIDVESLKSFWQDKNIIVKTSATSHILNSISSSPVNQAGAIAGNLISVATKVFAISLGVNPAFVPPGGILPQSNCGPAQAMAEAADPLKKKLVELRTKLADPDLNDAARSEIIKQIANLTAAISLVVPDANYDLVITKTIDPGFTPVEKPNPDTGYLSEREALAKPSRVDHDGLVAILMPTKEQLGKTKWYSDIQKLDEKEKTLLRIYVYLDFGHATPRIGCRSCTYPQTWVGRGNQFREVRYIPILVYQGPQSEKVLINNQPQPVPFGQFGIARGLPLSAGLFENLSWSVGFNDFGEMTDANFTSKSIGAQLTSFLSTAASGVNSIVTEQRNAATASSPETLRLTAENNALQAQINNINLNKQLRDLQSKGLAPQDSTTP